MNYITSKQEKYIRESIKYRNINHTSVYRSKKELSEDTKNRQLIQKFILEITLRMSDKEEILSLLNRKFEGTKYDAYRPFFEGWVQDKLKNKKRECDEER